MTVVMTSGEASSVAIVGAGPGGLAAAVLLAASGLRVVVYEAQPVIGGRTARLEKNGFRFDRGPTFFMMPYVLDEVFASAGKRLREEVDLRRLEPMYRLMIGRPGEASIQIDATQDIAEMGRRIGAIDARDGAAFARFIADNRYKLRHSESILRNPMRSPLDLFAAGTWKDTLRVAPVLKPHLSVHELLGSYFRNPSTKLAVSFQSKYLGMSPYDCPSLFTILPFIEYEYGIWHPIGGCAALMDALARVAQGMGVEIRTGSPVELVTFEGKRATGVVVGGRAIRHARVVVNADATWAMKKLVPAALRAGSDASDAALDAKKYSCSTFMLYLGVDGKVDLPHHTISVSADYRRNLEDITKGGCVSDDPSFYICNPSAMDPTLAPPGKSSLYVLVPTPSLRTSAGVTIWQDAAPGLRRKTFEQIGSVLGLRDLESRVESETMVTPDDWAGMNINFGATFNLAHNLGQMLHRRPQNKLKGFENLFLVGGGTHPGSGLPTIFLSAQITSRLICGELGVPFAGARDEVGMIARARAMAGDAVKAAVPG